MLIEKIRYKRADFSLMEIVILFTDVYRNLFSVDFVPIGC